MARQKPPENRQTVSVDGHRLTLTNLDKVLYPQTGTTKGEVLEYLATVAPVMIPWAKGRPATRKRWVHGVGTEGNPGKVFFQKNLDDSAPSWVKRQAIEHKEHTNVYPLVNDTATLTWLGQVAALEIHVPQWRFGHGGKPLNPDRLVLDLDPGEEAGLPECAEVARLARSILADMSLAPLPVTSGSKGIHLYAGLDGSQDADAINAFAHELARALEADHPDLIISDMKKTLRRGKVLVDWSQNNRAKTTICPYSLRGRFRPTVAAPRSWEELEDPDLGQLDMAAVMDRVRRGVDPHADGGPGAVADPGPAEEPGDGTGPDQETGIEPDALHRYRSMRDPAKTPEPVPAGPPQGAEGHGMQGRSFVIQEHHARRLHYDFRLERDGVLVSWAVPKGIPTDGRKNHLAVQTEDHPLEYGSFEGTIPKGEYGGGQVLIWDSGTYGLEKWRDGKEVIVTLDGQADGGLHGVRTRVALIHTGGDSAQAERNWLMHLMKEQPKTVPGAPAVLPPPDPAHRPSFIEPMMATAGNVRDIGDESAWDFEMKWDGMRAAAIVFDGSVRLVSRNGNDVTTAYPELASLADVVKRGGASTAVLDGEIVALDKAGRPDFRLLQRRMKLAKPAEISAGRKSTPVIFMVFDVLELNGESLLRRPLHHRRLALEALMSHADATIALSPLFEGDVNQAVATSQDLGLEGVLAKERDSSYSPGRRSRAWIKIKNQRMQEVVVAGWRTGNGTRAATLGSLLLGIPADGHLEYVGRVGSGFSDQDLVDMSRRFERMERSTSPLSDVPQADAKDAHWVIPKLVGEVTYTERTVDGRLRHPVWRGWRPDKEPAQVRAE
ncbi:MAG: ATP-dependent DNA ligase [Actinomycetota bacterium]|nr:ATP-dependent DNA ligase [Actinomycetota bacterium]